jgi:plastocyanin
MNKTTFAQGGKIILAFAIVGLVAAGCNRAKPPANSNIGQTRPTNPSAEVKAISVTGKKFAFDPKEIRVKKGDRVRIVFKSEGDMHDWKLDEFNAKTEVTEEGNSSGVEFTADRAGTFEYYCSIGNHRAMGMKGKFVVEE